MTIVERGILFRSGEGVYDGPSTCRHTATECLDEMATAGFFNADPTTDFEMVLNKNSSRYEVKGWTLNVYPREERPPHDYLNLSRIPSARLVAQRTFSPSLAYTYNDFLTVIFHPKTRTQ